MGWILGVVIAKNCFSRYQSENLYANLFYRKQNSYALGPGKVIASKTFFDIACNQNCSFLVKLLL
jgi:hypothetical protein